jgi:prepilin-type N-terminal cleavage/methylation domain-containing protein
MSKSEKGFSLLELLIVVAIILIIATIAIPSLLRSRQAANESAAVAELRTINTAQITYLSSAGGKYGDITMLVTAGLLDSRFANTATTPLSGYTFAVTLSGTPTGTDYVAAANPASTSTGRWGYYSSPDAVVRYTTDTALAPSGQAGQPVN